MAKHEFSEELRTFIKDKIQTVLRLEVLLLLHDHQPRSFNAAEIADELGFETETTQHQLMALEAFGLAVQSTRDECGFKYHPADATLGSKVDQLATAYARQRVPILSVILADTSDRTRLFAEAFKIIRRND
jgi:DNA-binding IclR family transcriptional regulator